MKYLIFFLLLLIPAGVFAAEASLFLSSSNGVYVNNKDVTVRVMVSSGGGVGVNAADGMIKFDPKKIKVKKITKDNSVFKLWPVEPKFSNASGTVSFAGGTSKAYKDAAGTLFNIVFTPVAKSGKVEVKIGTSSVLAADGWGNNILKKTGDGIYEFGDKKKAADADSVRKKFSGKILANAASSTKLWYLFPDDKKRYEITTVAQAKSVVNKFGIKASKNYFAKYKGKSFPAVIAGYFVLNKDDKMRPYYIGTDKKAYDLSGSSVASSTAASSTAPALDMVGILSKLKTKISSGDIFKIPDWAL